MRISDWSSDVCSSDLASSDPTGGNATVTNDAVADLDGLLAAAGNDVIVAGNGNDTLSGGALEAGAGARAKAWHAAHAEGSSTANAGTPEESRVGQEWARTCRARWSR